MKFFLIFFCGAIFANSPQNPVFDTFYLDPISYINKIRLDSDLNRFSHNKILDISSQNHAKYLIQNNHQSHDENANLPNFTGENPSKRALNVGLKTTYVLENISFNKDYETAIDSLFTAIYHRFAFLNFNVDEIGFGEFKDDKNSAFVFNMTNSRLNDFCKNPQNSTQSGYYILQICNDEKVKILKKRYDYFLNLNKNKFVVYPNKSRALAYFANEIPDPLPNCEISANPISIEFNKSLNIKMLNFEVFDDSSKSLKNIIIMDKTNDPNQKFTKNQFAFFPYEVLEFGKTYKAIFTYDEDGINKKIEWNFATKTPKNEYFVIDRAQKIEILPNKNYEIFFKPKNCNDLIKNFTYKYKNTKQPIVKNIAPNTVFINLNGVKGGFLEFNFDDERKVKFVLSKSGKGVVDYKFVVLISVFLLALLLFLWQKFKK